MALTLGYERFVRYQTNSATGATELLGPGGVMRVPSFYDPSLPILCLGGDHAYEQWYGTSDNGMAKMYRDYGLTPYMAINTATGSGYGAPGETGMMTWDQIRTVESGGLEVLSHGHRHIHQWGRLDTGIRIQYLGVNGTATVDIDGTPKTLILAAGAGEDGSFDLTNASYDTLAKLQTAINAVNGGASWLCTLAGELTGTERSVSMLSLIAPRDVVAGGNIEYFSAGGGIIISYTGAAYESAFVQVTTTLDIYLDGVRRSSFNLTNASYDTLGEMVTQIKALAVTGLTADLSDDTAGIYTRYTQGDEKSAELSKTLFLDLKNNGGVTLDGTGKANGARVDAGLPQSYLITRQFQASKDAALAEGIDLVNFAQSGGGFAQYHISGQNQFRSYRTNPAERLRFPGAHFAAVGPDYIRGHYVLDSVSTTKDVILAVLDAMVDSPGCIVDLLCHALTPASPAGVNGYDLPATDSLNPVGEADWIEILARIKTLVDTGKMIQVTPEQARRLRKFSPQPQNILFNPTFQNDGTSVLNTPSSFKVPGWLLDTTTANITAASIADGEFSLTTNSTENTTALLQGIILQRGKTYRLGARIKVSSLSSGSGVRLSLLPRMGRLPLQLPDDTSPTWASIWATSDQDISMMITVAEGSAIKPKIRGLVAGTFNIASGSTDTLSITVDAYTAVTVTLTAGAAQTASQIVADINAAFAGSATFTGKQEYWNIASVQGNKVVLEAPYVGEEYWNKLTVSGNGTATVFGYAACLAVPSASDLRVSSFPMDFRIQGQMAGTFSVVQPYCIKADLAY